MKEIYRILDANFNRAREALRVAEDCGRFALNDPAVTAMAKNLRSDLKEILTAMPAEQFIISRDTPGDIGTELSSPTEMKREGLGDVAIAACKRLTEALRTIEEYSKFVSPESVLKIERMRYNGYTLEQRLTEKLLARPRFKNVRLYALITSKMLCLDGGPRTGCVRDSAREALAGGADVIQLREKGIHDAEFLALAAELRKLTDEMGKLLIINDRADIAAMVGADGVHLGQHDLPIAETKRLLRPGAIVGRSTHTVAQARAAMLEGADYIGVGPMYETQTKISAETGPLVGPDLIRQLKDQISIPMVAIGGINVDNVGEVISAGAQCVAVCSSICSADDPKAAAAAFKKRINAAVTEQIS